MRNPEGALAMTLATRTVPGRMPAVYETMICLLKTQEDRARLTREVSERLLGKVA